MARSPFPEAAWDRPLDADHTDLLLDIAERAIVDGLRNSRPTVPTPDELPDELHRPVGAFVTLNVHGQLNGCIGSIETDEPVGVSVARHAWSAAFTDPRLPALRSTSRSLSCRRSRRSPRRHARPCSTRSSRAWTGC
jgi:hypothetical protein